MKALMLALWNGRLPLAQSFWLYAIVYGSLANLFATLLTLAAVAAGVPSALAALVFFLPLPYNVLAAVGVWRSASHYSGNPLWPVLARVFVALWAIVATLV